MRAQGTKERSCKGKERYSRFRAFMVAHNRGQVIGQALKPYRCRYCKSWHIGHVELQPRQP